jgi:Rieske Fe-S protein
MNRRAFIKLLLSIPMLGAAFLLVSPLFRYLKPGEASNPTPPFPEGLISQPLHPSRVEAVEFKLSDFPEPWVAQEFTYKQSNPEFTRQGAQISRIPGYALRIPGKTPDDYQFVVYSRICPHMGCIFKYVPDANESATGYNYVPPEGKPVFACPCHLSVYDPLQAGKVVSGPAPRPPRVFTFEVNKAHNLLRINELEQGGIA